MTKEMFESIALWQKETFGRATALSKLFHLMEEIDELKEELENYKNSSTSEQAFLYNTKIEMEFADCFILLFGSAASHGLSYNEILKIINEKMEINKARKWGNPDKDGVVNHIKD